MSGDGRCRTLHCERPARYRVWISARKEVRLGRVRNRILNEPWEGEFCHRHMSTSLNVKLLSLAVDDRIIVQRIDALS